MCHCNLQATKHYSCAPVCIDPLMLLYTLLSWTTCRRPHGWVATTWLFLHLDDVRRDTPPLGPIKSQQRRKHQHNMAARLKLPIFQRFYCFSCHRHPSIRASLRRNISLKHSSKSTSVAAPFEVYSEWESSANIKDPCYDTVDLSFENTAEAYKSKTNFDLIRALLVFNLCSIRPLVDRNKEVKGVIYCTIRSVIAFSLLINFSLGSSVGKLAIFVPKSGSLCSFSFCTWQHVDIQKHWCRNSSVKIHTLSKNWETKKLQRQSGTQIPEAQPIFCGGAHPLMSNHTVFSVFWG